MFNFDSMFEIHDDIEVLKRMGMACGLEVGKCSAEDLKVARSLVPKALEPYVIGQPQSGSLPLSLDPTRDKSASVSERRCSDVRVLAESRSHVCCHGASKGISRQEETQADCSLFTPLPLYTHNIGLQALQPKPQGQNSSF